jgi:hypothetical protein
LKGANQIVETNSPHKSGGQLSYPTDKLLAIVDTLPDAEYARIELIAAGFAPDAIAMQHGRYAAGRIVHYTDLDPFPHMARLLHVHSLEHEQAVVYEQALRRGQCVIAVKAPRAKDRERALGIMEAHNAHSIIFYGKWSIETLKP